LHRKEIEVEEARKVVEDRLRAQKRAAKVVQHQQLVDADAAVLEEDKRITAEVDSMMVRYGMIAYEPEKEDSHEAQIKGIFQRHKSVRDLELSSKNNNSNLSTKSGGGGGGGGGGGWGDDSDSQKKPGGFLVGGDGNQNFLKLTLKSGVDLIQLRKKLRKNAHRRTASLATPFNEDLSGTGEILALKGDGILEAGALSLAAELMRGACPMLNQLNLNKCQVRSDGIGRIFQGIKAANLLSLRVLNLRGNFIQAAGLQYMHEICHSGVFMNLALLDLSDNELGDSGVGVLVNMILQGYMSNVVEINLQHNSITDQGFNKIVSVLKSLKDSRCPNLERLRLENNLVSAKARRSNSPYPPYFSF
jgi:hypothetical protein